MSLSGNCIPNCQTGYIYNWTTKECELFTSPDKCKKNQIQIDNNCFDPCESGYFMSLSGNCIANCTNGYAYNKINKVCELIIPPDKCRIGQTQIGDKCFVNCKTGFFMDPSGNCIQNCTSGYNYNQTKQKCEFISLPDTCNPRQVKIDNKCFDACLSGYFMDQTGNCIQNCKENYIFNKLTYVCELIKQPDKCAPGQTKIGNNCFMNCISGYFMSLSGNCIENCKLGYTYNNKTKLCEKINLYDSCTSNQTQIGNKCFTNCISGTIMDKKGNCIKCLPNYIYNENTNKCELTTLPDKCADGFTQIDNKCFSNCKLGYFMNLSGNCVQNCLPGMKYDNITQECI
ncbi:MAG: hypothetical protein EBR91_11160 [Flavobacteriia bacterium]|nr:hypothetical protein [Flavobacteriia bacterium]